MVSPETRKIILAKIESLKNEKLPYVQECNNYKRLFVRAKTKIKDINKKINELKIDLK